MNTTAFNLGFKAVSSVLSAKRAVVDSTQSSVSTTKDVTTSFWAGMKAATQPMGAQYVEVKAPAAKKRATKKQGVKA